MRKALLSALGLCAGFGCHTAATEPGTSGSARATAAIRALGERDGSAVAQCQRAVDACNARLPDAAGGGACTRLAERCDALQDRLAELREPSEGCWRAVDACDTRAPEQAHCSRDLSLCDSLDQEASGDRDKALECEARVQACLLRAEQLPEAALVACENIAAACDRVAEKRDKPQRSDAGTQSDDDESQDDDSSGHDDANDDGTSDGDDSAGDDDGVGAQRPRSPRPNVGRGRDRAPDGGVAADD